jgi:hypothetical protein
MSNKNSTGTRRTAVGVGMAAGAAIAAAMFGMGTAHAVTAPSGDQGFEILFGGDGTDSGVTTAQASDNAAADLALSQSSSGDAASFDTLASSFEAGNAHPIADLVQSIDPAAFSDQVTPGITGTLEGGAYLVPENLLGYIATDLDYFALNPTGLDYLLAPVIELLVGSPAF